MWWLFSRCDQSEFQIHVKLLVRSHWTQVFPVNYTLGLNHLSVSWLCQPIMCAFLFFHLCILIISRRSVSGGEEREALSEVSDRFQLERSRSAVARLEVGPQATALPDYQNSEGRGVHEARTSRPSVVPRLAGQLDEGHRGPIPSGQPWRRAEAEGGAVLPGYETNQRTSSTAGYHEDLRGMLPRAR